MSVTMQGPWTVSVKSKNAKFAQRFVITGSSNGVDGPYEYSGSMPPGPVDVQGSQWTVAVEHRQKKTSPWLSSAERLGTPSQSGSAVKVEIRSNDTGGDVDYNDLVLECTTTVSDLDHVIYGKVRSYSGFCRFNPCWRGYLVLETAKQFEHALADGAVRAVAERLYPQRIRQLEKARERPELEEGGFQTVMIPLSGEARRADDSVANKAVLGSSVATASDYSIAAKYKDLFRLVPCKVRVEPEQLLRFIEYDRTEEESGGGAYTGTGFREILGLTVTDEVGNYVFRFTRTLADVQAEGEAEAPDGTATATQLRPDVIVQLVGPGMGPTEFLYETGLHSDIPTLKRIDLCFPESDLKRVTCGTGRVLERIGDVRVSPGVTGNTFDTDGRISVHDGFAGFEIDRAAWTGSLNLWGCFSELRPNPVKYYTIRYRRGTDPWQFVSEEEFRSNKSGLGLPSNHPINRIGPNPQSLKVDGGSAQDVSAYDNIETDTNWAASSRHLKLQMDTTQYAAKGNPGTVEFRIDGYDAGGNPVPGSDDELELFIDNDPADGEIESIALGGDSPDECALFDLPTPNEPLTVTFKAKQPNGHLQKYEIKVWRGSNFEMSVSGTKPLVKSYQTSMGASFLGTANVSGNILGSLVSDVTPTVGDWLPAGKDFCAFAFELWTTRRVTNGRTAEPATREHIELIGISYTLPVP